MTPYHQLEKHDPANGKWGDCIRAAIASLIDMDPRQVPHWARESELVDGDPVIMWQHIDEWLAEHGYCRWTTAYSGDMERDELLSILATTNPGIYYMLCGNSADDVGHVVICRDGLIVHDSSWTQCGVRKPVNGLWVVMVLLPLQMTQYRGSTV